MDNFRANIVFKDTDMSVVAVQSTSYQIGSLAQNLIHVFGCIEPYAILVCRENDLCVLDMDSNPISIEQLRQSVPELDTLLEPLILPPLHLL